MSTIVHYGLEKAYSLSFMEEHIGSCSFVRDLEERSDSSFLNRITSTQIVEEIYGKDIDKAVLNNRSDISIWVGEAYIRLFFKYHKSFAYLFLYFPIDEMLNRYTIYHEMDWTQLYELFKEKTSKKTLLKSLIEKRNISVNKLSVISNISQATLQYYCESDERLYLASFKHINALSFALNINSNIFLESIHNYTNSAAYSFDKTRQDYRSYLGLNFASYFSQEINSMRFEYDSDKNIFEGKGMYLKVLWTASKPIINIDSSYNPSIETILGKYSTKIPTEQRCHYIVVVFEYDHISTTAKAYEALISKFGFKRIIIINQEYYISINNKVLTFEISDYLNMQMIEKAKRQVGGDFAL